MTALCWAIQSGVKSTIELLIPKTRANLGQALSLVARNQGKLIDSLMVLVEKVSQEEEVQEQQVL